MTMRKMVDGVAVVVRDVQRTPLLTLLLLLLLALLMLHDCRGHQPTRYNICPDGDPSCGPQTGSSLKPDTIQLELTLRTPPGPPETKVEATK
ncbi:MAG TPA: hypothetical protein VFT22_05695 [Kofleriaceae bacterium]|nr:hypothetical protein [Kofleriaceae bacterium]